MSPIFCTPFLCLLCPRIFRRRNADAAENAGIAAQIPAELFDRLDRYLKERGIKKKDFLVDIITRALEEDEAAEPVTEASPQDELEEQPEADET